MIDIHRLPFWPVLRLPYRFARSSLQLAVDKTLGVQTTLLDNELHIGLDRPATFKHAPVGWITLWRIFSTRFSQPTPRAQRRRIASSVKETGDVLDPCRAPPTEGQ